MNANATSILETSRRDFIKTGAVVTGGLRGRGHAQRDAQHQPAARDGQGR